MKQVEKSHYRFQNYENEARFTSYYHQLKAVFELKPETLLEIGGGTGCFLALARNSGITTWSADVDVELQPTVAASVLQLPFKEGVVDVCVAFQVLEHLPFDSFQRALLELARVSKAGVVISLPDFGNAGMVLSFPYVRKLIFSFRVLPFMPKHRFDGEHYWEISKSGFSLKKIMQAFSESGLDCTGSWLNPYNPYHRFFVLKKIDATQR